MSECKTEDDCTRPMWCRARNRCTKHDVLPPMDVVVCTKPLQVKAWINNNKLLWEFWQRVVAEENYGLQNKTREEAVALLNYYQGRYDIACDFNSILEVKNESKRG